MSPLSLQQRFGSDSKTDPYDTRQVKQALNRLGYYTPLNKTGTGIWPPMNPIAGK